MRAFLLFFGLMLGALASIAVFAYPAWLLLHPHFEFPFHRIGERIGMLTLGFGFFITARRLGLRDWTAAAGITAAALVKLVALRLVSGLAVAFIEETFLRGAMHTGIERESGVRAAVILTAVVYSATHFFASFRIPAAEVSASSGVALLEGTLQSFDHPLGIADAFLCLVAVGILLGRVRVATGNIAACIGIHAGWVWVMLVVHALTQPVRTAPLSFLLSSFDGF